METYLRYGPNIHLNVYFIEKVEQYKTCRSRLVNKYMNEIDKGNIQIVLNMYNDIIDLFGLPRGHGGDHPGW